MRRWIAPILVGIAWLLVNQFVLGDAVPTQTHLATFAAIAFSYFVGLIDGVLELDKRGR